jgi:hypothetical protein
MNVSTLTDMITSVGAVCTFSFTISLVFCAPKFVDPHILLRRRGSCEYTQKAIPNKGSFRRRISGGGLLFPEAKTKMRLLSCDSR